MLSLRLPGSLSLRLAERAFPPLLFHEPPRNTRLSPATTTLVAARAERSEVTLVQSLTGRHSAKGAVRG